VTMCGRRLPTYAWGGSALSQNYGSRLETIKSGALSHFSPPTGANNQVGQLLRSDATDSIFSSAPTDAAPRPVPLACWSRQECSKLGERSLAGPERRLG